MAQGYGYGQSGFSRRAATPVAPRAPRAPAPPHYGSNPTNTYGVGGNSTSGEGGPAVGQYPPAGSYPPPPANSGAGSGAYTPSWNPNAWQSDPGYLMALAQQQQGNTQLDAWLKQTRTNSLVDFGDPNLAIPGFNLDPVTKAMIQQNYNSGNAQLARLDQAHTLGLRGVVNALAGRGLLFSGDLGYQQGQQNQLYGHNVYDARNALLSSLSNAYQSYLQQKNQYASAVAQAAQQAEANSVNQMMNGY